MTELTDEEQKVINDIKKQSMHCVYLRTDDGQIYIGGYAGMGESDAMPILDQNRTAAVLSLLDRGIIEEGDPSGNYHLLDLWEEEDGFHMIGTGQWIHGKKLRILGN